MRERRLRVQLTDLQGAVLGVQAQIPPEERDVLEPAGGDRGARQLLPVGEVADVAWNAAARVGPDEGCAGARKARVGAEPPGAVGAQTLQQGKLASQSVEG